jgi:PIN domain nuclease of toxin-antitoxin system
MTIWELANKAAKGRVSLAPSADEWIERAAALPGFRFAMPDRATPLLSTRLPNLRASDPTDPVEAAGGGSVATADRVIRAGRSP